MNINLTEIIRNRLGRKSRFIPGPLLRVLERIICQDELNAMLEYAHPARGSEFSKKILEHLNIRLQIEGLQHLPENEPLVFASNHPLGGLDGIALVAVLGDRYGDDRIRVLVNDLLLNVEPLRHVFLPVNKFGAQGRKAALALNDALTSGLHVLMFPAGLVSRLQKNAGSKDSKSTIRDLQWQKTFVSKAIENHRRIIPIRFEAQNSMRFYKLARLRKRLKIKFNIEQVLLPSEVTKSHNKTFTITFLPPVDPATLISEGLTPTQIASKLRDLIYKH